MIRINVIESGVGGITESDAHPARPRPRPSIIGFNVRADASARRIIENNGLDLRYFSIIYDVIDQVKQVASGLLGVEIREEIIGIAEVRDVFRSSKFGAVAGCWSSRARSSATSRSACCATASWCSRASWNRCAASRTSSTRSSSGTECGIAVKAYNDVQPGDQIECFERIEVKRTL